jgi:hypothetical protein
MSKVAEEKVIVPDVWSGKKIEKDIAEFKSGHSKEVERLKRKVAELEHDLGSAEKAFWMGVIGLTIFNLAVVAMFVF